MPKSALDTRMHQPIGIRWESAARTVLRVLTFLPLLFILPAVFTGNGAALDAGEADVLGTGAEILLILTLLVTPVVLLTGWRWLVPLRRWYGVMFAVTAIADAIVASVTTSFSGDVVGRLTGHTFLLVGLAMVVLLLPLLLTATNYAQRQLGKYWKLLHRLLYVIWGLLWVHLALLEGFGVERGDGLAAFHQRLYQFTAVSIPLLALRLPPVKRWIAAKQKQDKMWQVYWAIAPLMLLFLVGYVFIEHEFLFKGIDLFRLHPSED